jgi:hypothetical protein
LRGIAAGGAAAFYAYLVFIVFERGWNGLCISDVLNLFCPRIIIR